MMPQLGKLYIDVALLARQMNFPPEHGIVGMGYDQQNGGFLIVGGPTLPHSDGQDIPSVSLDASFFGGAFSVPPGTGPMNTGG
jgi:hypothetical protein